jgi:probable addiction module antidote protein
MSKARKKAGSRGKAVRVAAFDPAEFLDSEEVIAEYLSAAIEDPNPDVFLRAMANAARARGIGEIAKSSGLGRESLYKALAPGAKVRTKPSVRCLTRWASS